MSTKERTNIENAIRDLRGAIGDAEGLEWQLRDVLGHLEDESPKDKLAESGLIPGLIRVLQDARRRVADSDPFGLAADLDDAVRELEAIR